MIINLYRTILELKNYLGEIPYAKSRIFLYISVSVIIGILLSNSSRAADLPLLTVTAILFGFTINAIVMLGNSSENYLASEIKHSEQLEKYYKKSLYISIHTLGIGILTIIVVGIYNLFPNVSYSLVQMQLIGYEIRVEMLSSIAYAFVVYYLFVFSIVIASTAELVKIRI